MFEINENEFRGPLTAHRDDGKRFVVHADEKLIAIFRCAVRA
jgi:hypothetical protein